MAHGLGCIPLPFSGREGHLSLLKGATLAEMGVLVPYRTPGKTTSKK